MPPKVVPFPFIPGNGPPLNTNHTNPDPYKDEALKDEIAAIQAVPGVAAGLTIALYSHSDITTHNVHAIVIATDIDMRTRAEPTYTKFHRLAGPNLKLWNDNVHYSLQTDLAGKVTSVSDLTPATTAKMSPSFRTATNRYLIFVNVPDFRNGAMRNGWRGNGAELYECYIKAFIDALASPFVGLPAAVAAALPLGPLYVVGPILPSTLAFSFMGPAQGWNTQEAALIAVTAIRDAAMGPPGGVFPPASALTAALVAQIQAQFTRIHICATHAKTHQPKVQYRALQRAFNQIFGGGPAVRLPVAPNTVTPLRVTRSGARYGN